MAYHKYWNGLTQHFLFLFIIFNPASAFSESIHNQEHNIDKINGLVKEDIGAIFFFLNSDSHSLQNYNEKLPNHKVKPSLNNPLIFNEGHYFEPQSDKYNTRNERQELWKKLGFVARGPSSSKILFDSILSDTGGQSAPLVGTYHTGNLAKSDIVDSSGKSSVAGKAIPQQIRVKRETDLNASVKNESSYSGIDKSAITNGSAAVNNDKFVNDTESTSTDIPLKFHNSSVQNDQQLKSFSENISNTQESSNVSSVDTSPTLTTTTSVDEPSFTIPPSFNVSENTVVDKITSTNSTSKSTIGTTRLNAVNDVTSTASSESSFTITEPAKSQFIPSSSTLTSQSSSINLTSDTQSSLTSHSPTSPSFVEQTGSNSSSSTSTHAVNKNNFETTFSSTEKNQAITKTEPSSSTSSNLSTIVSSSSLPLAVTTRISSTTESPQVLTSSTKTVIMSQTPTTILSVNETEGTTTQQIQEGTSSPSVLTSSNVIPSKDLQDKTSVTQFPTTLSTISYKTPESVSQAPGSVSLSTVLEVSTASEPTPSSSPLRPAQSTPHLISVSDASPVSVYHTPEPEHVSSLSSSGMLTTQQTISTSESQVMSSTRLPSPPSSEPVSEASTSVFDEMSASYNDSTTMLTPTSPPTFVSESETSVSASPNVSTAVLPKSISIETSTENSTLSGMTTTNEMKTSKTSLVDPEPTSEQQPSSSQRQHVFNLTSTVPRTSKGITTESISSTSLINKNITMSSTLVTSDKVEADTRETVTLVPDLTISAMPSLPSFNISVATGDDLNLSTTGPNKPSVSDYVTLDLTTFEPTGTRESPFSEPEPETTITEPPSEPKKHTITPEPETEPENGKPWLPNVKVNTTVKPSNIPSEAEPMDIAFAEPGPDWEIAFPLWKGAWDVHIYMIGIMFFILAIYMFISIIRLWRIPRLLSRPYFLTLNFLIFFTCSVRAFYLLYGRYNAEKQFHVAVNYFLYSIAFPCLTATFSILFYALLQATKMRFLSPNVQRLPVLITIIVFHFLFSIVTDIFVGQFASSHVLLFICQLIFVTWGFFLFIGYIFIFRRLYLSAKNRQRAMQQVVPSAKGSLRSKLTLSLGIKVTMLAAVFGFLIVVLEIYAMADVYNVFSTKIPEPWPWFIFESCLRLTEWFMCLTMAYVSSQPFRGKKNNTYGWLFYFTSCLKMINCNSSKEEHEQQWTNVKESISMSECHQHSTETSKPVSGSTKLKNKIKQLNFLEKRKAEKSQKGSKNKSANKSMLVVEEGFIRFRREDEMSEAGNSESTSSSGKVNDPLQYLPSNGNITNVNKCCSNGIINNGYSNTFDANKRVGSYSHRNSISSDELFRGPSSLNLAASIEWELDKTIYGKKRTDPDGISLHSTYSSPMEGYDKKHRFCSSTPQTILKQYSKFEANNECTSKPSEKYFRSQSTLSLKSTSSEHSVFLKKDKANLIRCQSENPDRLPMRTVNSVKYYSLTDLEEQLRDSESDDSEDHLRVVEELRRFSIVSQNLNKVLGLSDRSSTDRSLSDISVNSRVQFIEGSKDEEQSFC